MPFQVKAGSLILVAMNSVEALRVFDSLSKDSEEPVYIRDMEGVEIDPERLRPIVEGNQ